MQALLAEGSPFNRRLAAALLEKQGFTVVSVSSGQEAIEHFHNSQFDLVLLDAQLPGMDGSATASAMRSREAAAGGHVPILVLTASDGPPRDRTTGVDGYLARPLHPASLSTAVAQHVRASEPLQNRIDWTTALELVEGRRQLLVELSEIFLDEHQRLLEQIEQSIESGDAENLQVHAHGLKGCLRYFGETQAVAHAAQLEDLGRESSVAGASELFGDLVAAIQELLPEIKEFASS